MTLKLVQPGVYLSIIQSLRPLSYTPKQQRLRIPIRIHPQDIQSNPRRRPVVPASNNVPIADDEDEFPLVIVIERSKRVNGTSERVFAFGITGNLAEHEFILQLWVAFGTELESRQDCQR